jgi:hypothetical protein
MLSRPVLPREERRGLGGAAKACHPRFARRGRAALLWAVAIFALGQAALAVAIDWRFSEIRDPPYGYKERRLLRRLLVTGGTRPTVVMVGSSRTENGLRGHDAERMLAGSDGSPVVFNFGLMATGPATELLTVRRLLARGVRPDLLLVEVLPTLLAGQVTTADLSNLSADHLWYSDLAPLKRCRLSGRLRAAWWAAELLPCHTHRFALLSAIAPGLLPAPRRQDWYDVADDSGWEPSPSPGHDPARRRRASDRVLEGHAGHLAGFHLGGPNPAALRELLALCRREGIPTVLVLMPEGSALRAGYPSAARAQIEDFLGELHRYYGAGVVDARDWLADEEFTDSHHPYPEGAARFTARLAREVIAPRLSSTSRRSLARSAAE